MFERFQHNSEARKVHTQSTVACNFRSKPPVACDLWVYSDRLLVVAGAMLPILLSERCYRAVVLRPPGGLQDAPADILSADAGANRHQCGPLRGEELSRDDARYRTAPRSPLMLASQKFGLGALFGLTCGDDWTAHGADSTLSLVPEGDGRCFCVGTPGESCSCL